MLKFENSNFKIIIGYIIYKDLKILPEWFNFTILDGIRIWFFKVKCFFDFVIQ